MNKKIFNKWNRIIHRDLGFFFFGVTIIYALSGIALNHLRDWNPNYIIHTYSKPIPNAADYKKADKAKVKTMLQQIGETAKYKKHIYNGNTSMKIFIQQGSAVLDFNTGILTVETIKRRPLFYQVNYLHYNPGKWWKWFSDIFAVSLIIIAISGIIITKGKKGIKGRGGLYILLGIIVPILFLLFW